MRTWLALMLLPSLCTGCWVSLDKRFEAQPDETDAAVDASTDAAADASNDAAHEGDADLDADVEPPLPTVWTSVAVGGEHTCAIRDDKALFCWGHGWNGRLGDGTSIGSPTPRRVVASVESEESPWSDWISVTSGGGHSCGIREDGSAWCWGLGGDGQLGDAATTGTRTTPKRVLAASGTNTYWSDWAQLSAGDSHTCGRRDNGTLWCWGSNGLGWLGDGTTSVRRRPVRVLATDEEAGGAAWSDFGDVAAGTTHTCAGRTSGALYCWGSTYRGSLGEGTVTPIWRTTPQRVLAPVELAAAPFSNWAMSALGTRHSCGLGEDGRILCWGLGDQGQRGDGTTTNDRGTPIPVVQAGQSAGGSVHSDWTHVTSGASHVCALRVGQAYCWGGGSDGQRGDGATASERTSPRVVLAEGEALGGHAWDDWIELSSSSASSHMCGIREDGSLWCWGRGDRGQRGDGATSTVQATPVRVMEP